MALFSGSLKNGFDVSSYRSKLGLSLSDADFNIEFISSTLSALRTRLSDLVVITDYSNAEEVAYLEFCRRRYDVLFRCVLFMGLDGKFENMEAIINELQELPK